jgi:TRAP-type mannitol/chloroaromatic compound transport system permease large subunit
MMGFIAQNMAPIMFGSLIVFLLFGYPVAFSLAACGLLFGVIGVEMGLMPQTLLQALPLRIFGIMQNDTLLAIPFFTFMGLILERSGMAEDLLDTVGQLFGPIRGGLAYAVILVGAMLAATTGVVAASVISMGLISLPIMLRYGYDRRLATGAIAASGTLAQIIPPSLVLIVLADQLGRSVGDLTRAPSSPGFVLTGLYLLYVLTISIIHPTRAPALPAEARTIREDDGSAGLRSLGILVVLSVAAAIVFARTRPATASTDELIVVSMCVGVGFAFALAMLNRLLRPWLAVAHGGEGHVRPHTAPGAHLPGARHDLPRHRHADRRRCHGRRRSAGDGAGAPAHELQADAASPRFDHEAVVLRALHPHRLDRIQPLLPGGRRPDLGRAPADQPPGRAARLPDRRQHPDLPARVLPRLLRAGLHHHPLIAPVADKLGIDLVWFGVLLAINMQTSFMHPPFGFALFYLRSVAPMDDYKDCIHAAAGGDRSPTVQIYCGSGAVRGDPRSIIGAPGDRVPALVRGISGRHRPSTSDKHLQDHARAPGSGGPAKGCRSAGPAPPPECAAGTGVTREEDPARVDQAIRREKAQ